MVWRPERPNSQRWLLAGLLLCSADVSLAQIQPIGGTGPNRALTFLPGVRATVTVSDSLGTANGSGAAGIGLEVTPYLNASIANARTQGSLSYAMRNFYAHTSDSSDFFVRHDLRASLNSLLIGDWFGVQSSAAIYNTNATIAGGLSADPGASLNNNAVLRTFSVAPYIQGRVGSFATYRTQYRYEQSDTSGNVAAALARASHTVSLNVASGPQFNPWGWGFNSSGSHREYANNRTLSNASAIATLYYAPSAELRLGASVNYLYLEGLTNSDGQSNGWGPGLSVDWTPSRRTTVRASITRQYYGTSGFLSLAHRTNRFVFGLNYDRSVLQSNNAALLTFNPGQLLSGGGFAPDLNPLFNQLNSLGLLSNSNTILGTNIINDALVRNRTVTASVGYVMPRWSATATMFKSTRETLLSSEVFGIPSASSTSFGLFNTTGVTVAGTVTLDGRNSVGVSANTYDTTSSNGGAKTRFSNVQATYSSRIDALSSASVGIRRSVQTGAFSGSGNGVNTLFGTYDHRFR